MSFKQEFFFMQESIRETKLFLARHRALNLQVRNKIKPAALRPDLLVAPRMRGGDSQFPIENPLSIYYPR